MGQQGLRRIRGKAGTDLVHTYKHSGFLADVPGINLSRDLDKYHQDTESRKQIIQAVEHGAIYIMSNLVKLDSIAHGSANTPQNTGVDDDKI